MRFEHDFEDEEGNEIPLTDITYEVIKTYVQPVDDELFGEPTTVFTHIVKIRPESFDLELAMMNMTKEDVEDAMRGEQSEYLGGTSNGESQ
jgi:hypothetical protein